MQRPASLRRRVCLGRAAVDAVQVRRKRGTLRRLIVKGVAEKVLAFIGNKDRINLLLAILRAPRTVAQMVGGMRIYVDGAGVPPPETADGR